MTCRLIAWTLLVFAAGLWSGQTLAQPRARMWTKVLLRTVAEDIPPKAGVQVNDDHWEPGAETGTHRHPGPTIIYVLEGELSESAGGGTTRLKAGEAVWRPAHHEHNVRNAGSRPARAVAIHLDPVR
ncbi:MAG TPA: cupin domain-containing protein [Methylomirabilota bacterium]|nr:cupin domain-containing protein [Methylomirabilota bacterium]